MPTHNYSTIGLRVVKFYRVGGCTEVNGQSINSLMVRLATKYTHRFMSSWLPARPLQYSVGVLSQPSSGWAMKEFKSPEGYDEVRSKTLAFEWVEVDTWKPFLTRHETGAADPPPVGRSWLSDFGSNLPSSTPWLGTAVQRLLWKPW